MNSPLFNIYKKYYEKGIYNKDQLQIFLAAGKITKKEYNEIINESK